MRFVRRHWWTGVTIIASLMVIVLGGSQPAHFDWGYLVHWRYLGAVVAFAVAIYGSARAIRS
jgi:hypothetical protein